MEGKGQIDHQDWQNLMTDINNEYKDLLEMLSDPKILFKEMIVMGDMKGQTRVTRQDQTCVSFERLDEMFSKLRNRYNRSMVDKPLGLKV